MHATYAAGLCCLQFSLGKYALQSIIRLLNSLFSEESDVLIDAAPVF